MFVVVAQRDKFEKQLLAGGCDRPAEQLQQRLFVVGQRALHHKQRAVAARVLVQHHVLLALGVAAQERRERVLEAARKHAVRGVFQQLADRVAVVGRKVAHALHFASGLAVLERDQLTDDVEGKKELEVKALREKLAGELGLGERHKVC